MRSTKRPPRWVATAAVPLVAGAVALAFWIGGGKITNGFAASLVITAVLVGAVGLAALAASLRFRQLAAPLLATFVVSSGAIGGYLAWASLRDKVVDERVVVAQPAAAPGSPVELAGGSFASGAHETVGRASVIELPEGSRVLTLTASRPTLDPAEVGSIVIWCRAFSVSFGTAALTPG